MTSPSRKVARLIVGTVRVVVPLAILAVGVFGAYVLIRTKPEVPKAERVERPTFVETAPLEAHDHAVRFEAFGTVQSFRRVDLQPQVSGIVVEQYDGLLRGHTVREGTLIVRIDPRDYRLEVEQREADVVRAEFELQLEQGRQIVAKREWDLLDDSLRRPSTPEPSELSQSLALRKPQLKDKTAALAAAKSRLARAELDLARTEIRAPFDALILEESVELGQLVTSQSPVATLVDVREYHVQVSLPVDRITEVRFPSSEQPNGASVSITRDVRGPRDASGGPSTYEGRVVQLVGDVDPTGRMARLLVSVRDPLGIESGGERRAAPLLLGEYVRVLIDGPVLEDVVEISRAAVREGNQAWVMTEDGTLALRDLDVRHGTDTVVYAADTFEPGDALVLTPLAAAVPGMKLTTATDADADPSGASEDDDA